MGSLNPFPPKPSSCADCPAYTWGLGFVPGMGPERATVAVLGQGPGEQEARYSVPFFEKAPAGGKLRLSWLPKGGFQLTRTWIGNVVQCWLPEHKRGRPVGNRAPTKAEQAYCWKTHVAPQVRKLTRIQAVIPVGTPAGEFLLSPSVGSKVGERYAGTVTRGRLPAA